MTENSAVVRETEQESREYSGSFTLHKNIHSTAYEVVVYFSKTSRETLTDKIRRMIQNEARQ
ncbi:MAG: transposon-encoded TnpW family protein [Treponema sp.]|jgi:hypothetical protein|nr:transposon-encoded TnpW family protein [Treponema sp.]